MVSTIPPSRVLGPPSHAARQEPVEGGLVLGDHDAFRCDPSAHVDRGASPYAVDALDPGSAEVAA